MKKALVIFNPTAGVASKQDAKKEVGEKLQAHGYQPIFLILDFSFEMAIADLNLSDVELVVAVGGDGTVKVATREIISRRIEAPLLIIPFGSANVLASTLKLPLNIKEALALLDSKRTIKVDVGIINRERYFLVGFSLGYVSLIVTGTKTGLKNRFGSLGYLVRLFSNSLKIHRLNFRIETQNRVFWVRGNSLIIFNAFNYFGFQPKKEISITDGILNLYVVTNRTFWELLEAAVGVLFYDRPPKHIFTLDNKYFRIMVRRRGFLKTAQIDGDKIKLMGKNITVEVLPQALTVISK